MLTIEGNTVTNEGVFRKRIEINPDGVIETIGEPKGNADFLFGEELIFPGFIDLHVHAREDASGRDTHKEDFETAGAAARSGGVVAMAEMPNNPVPPVDDESYVEKTALATKAGVDVILYAGIGPKTEPLSEEVPYKVFMGKSVGDLFFSTTEELEETLRKYSGQSVSFHAEDPKILESSAGEAKHELRRPAAAEVAGIDFALRLMEKYNITGKICHVSTAAGLQKIIEAKKKGIQVTAEVTPHHLYFAGIPEGHEKTLQVNPPIRTEADHRALLSALRDGDIDYLATDHAPHTTEEKEKDVSGLPHLDTYGPFVCWLMKEEGFKPADIARIASENPGKFFSRFTGEQYGAVEPGYVGSLTILDLNKPITITREILKTKCAWSPFEGMTFPGRVAATVVRGKMYKHD